MNNMEACTDPPVLSRWALRQPHDLDPPECVQMPYSRDNHHGTTPAAFLPSAQRLNWKRLSVATESGAVCPMQATARTASQSVTIGLFHARKTFSVACLKRCPS